MEIPRQPLASAFALVVALWKPGCLLVVGVGRLANTNTIGHVLACHEEPSTSANRKFQPSVKIIINGETFV